MKHKFLIFNFKFLIFFALSAMTARAGVITYTPDDVSIFPNPERGFTEELGGELALTDSKNHVVLPEADWYFDMDDPENADRRTQTLVVLMYYLKNYRTKDLSQQILQGFSEDMQLLRQHGFKCVLRFAYDWKSKNDASLSWVQRHIEQLTPYLQANSDIIYVLEAGFVGEWGEWYYSSNFGNETQELNANRRAVLQALLQACPADRFLLVRYPLIKLSYLGDEIPLDDTQAYSATPRARIGHHNDAFLNAWGNDGTYGRNGDGPDDDPVLRAYIAQETLYVPNGGETNVEEHPLADIVSQHDTTIAELRRYHWTFCGSNYSEDVTDTWRENGTYQEMERILGYRLQLLQATLPNAGVAGQQLPIQLRIRNTGCAPLYNPRTAYLVLQGPDTTVSLPLSSDPRRWLPNGVEIDIQESLTLPADLPEGTYQLFLHLPDAAATLAGDPRYAVRLANVGTWDATTGMNRLQAAIAISHSASALSMPTVTTDAEKILHNGQLYIRRGGELFDPLGRKI